IVRLENEDGIAGMQRVVKNVMGVTQAESLRRVESLVAYAATMTHASMDEEARRTAGSADSLLRLSVGIEDGEDLSADLTSALDAVVARSDELADPEPEEIGAGI